MAKRTGESKEEHRRLNVAPGKDIVPSAASGSSISEISDVSKQPGDTRVREPRIAVKDICKRDGKDGFVVVNSGGSIAYGVHIESIDRYLFQDCPALPPGATGFVAFAGVYEGFGIYSLLRNLGCKNEVIEHKVTVNYQDAKGFQYKTTGTLKITDRRMAHFEVTQFSKVS